MARSTEMMRRPNSWRQTELRVLLADRIDAALARSGVRVGADHLQSILVVALLDIGALLADDPGAQRLDGPR